MHNWTGRLNLIGATYEKDKNGVQRKTETKTPVRADLSSTRQSEFFDAGRAGLKVADSVFTIPARRYHGEEVVEYRGRRLAVYRTYQVTDDLIELHCEEKGGTNGKANADR